MQSFVRSFWGYMLLGVVALLCWPSPVSAQEGPVLGTVAQQILDDVNRARGDHGLPPLALNAALTEAAQRHVDDVIASGRWGHYGSDGSNIYQRAARAGYPSSAVSENWVAVGAPERAIVWWMNDWIHRVNILGTHWDDIGVGAGWTPGGMYIFVTDFGNRDGGVPGHVASQPARVSAPPQPLPEGGLAYTVQPGDTLLAIAIRHGLDWQDIALANALQEQDILSIGQVLHLPSIEEAIPPADGSSESDPSESDRSAGSAVAAFGVTSSAQMQKYTVRAGDTALAIALSHGIGLQDLYLSNNLDDQSYLQIGQVLAIPNAVGSAEVPAEPTASAQQRTYRVQTGDTVFAIALRHGVDWQEMLRVNGLNEQSLLQPGQSLTIP
ncbi:MAG: LysM peptidoglycan-binding domain-containing protein [Caldilinea sp.]